MMKKTMSHGQGMTWAARILGIALVCAVPAVAAAQELTVLPPTPQVGALNDTQVEINSSTNLTITYDHTEDTNAFSGVWIQYTDGARDLSGVTQFVFAVKGDPDVITVEFKDDDGGVSSLVSPNLTDEFQIWSVDAADVTDEGVDLSALEELVFVVHSWSGGDEAGEVVIAVGGLPFTLVVDPSDPGDAPLTVLPGNPALGEVAGTDFTQHSSTNFTIDYDVTEEPFFAAVIAAWDAPTNLTAITEFVFGVAGDPDAIAVEFEDGEGAKTVIHLAGVTDTLQHWHIDASEIANLDSIEGIVFVVSDTLAGAGNHIGECTVYVGGLDYEPPPPDPIDVDPSDPGDAPLTVLPDEPLVSDLAGTLFLQHSSNSFTVAYDLDASDDGWEGAMVRWEDFATVDLSGVTQFVFGVQGDPDAIKVEFEDEDGVKVIFNLNGVTDSLQHWHIDASEIDFLDALQVITFVVDEDLAGEGNEAGTYTVFVDGLSFAESAMSIAPADTLTDVTILPDDPTLSDLVGTAFEQHSATKFTVLYDLDAAEQDWEGVRIHRDGLPMDLTSIDSFVVGITGTPQSVKMEIKDFSGGETILFLDGVTDSMQQWSFNAALIPNRDDIEVITFVVDYGLAGDGNEAGAFSVFLGGLDYDEEEPEEPVFMHDSFHVDLDAGHPVVTVNLGVGLDQYTYILEFTTDLTSTPVNWLEAGEPFDGDGAAEVILTHDDDDVDDMRFYRIKRTPTGE